MISLIIPLLIIGAIFYFARWRRHHLSAKHDFFDLAVSKEDLLAQVYYLMALFFLGATLFALNRDLGDIIEWQTVILLTALIGIAGSYLFKMLFTLPFSLIGLCVWYGTESVAWVEGKDIKGMVVLSGVTLLFILFYVLGKAHLADIKFKRFSYVYNILGLISATGVMFVLSTKMGLDVFSHLTEGAQIFSSWQAEVSLTVIVLALLAGFGFSLKKKLISKTEAIFVGLLAVMFVIFLFIPEQDITIPSTFRYMYISQDFSSNGLIWAFFFNVFIFLQLVGIVLSGYINRESWMINLGALMLFLLIIVKYFDWFFTFFDKSIFFISAGVLLFLVGGLMEKGRRYMLKSMNEEKENSLE